MAKQIRVYGQSQKWTALGIVAAYLEGGQHCRQRKRRQIR